MNLIEKNANEIKTKPKRRLITVLFKSQINKPSISALGNTTKGKAI